jgi:uncharacterized protein YecA (UPF0149 family)
VTFDRLATTIRARQRAEAGFPGPAPQPSFSRRDTIGGRGTFSWREDFLPSQPGSLQEPPKKWGRNAPCPCGSGRKFKKCCGGSHPRLADP